MRPISDHFTPSDERRDTVWEPRHESISHQATQVSVMGARKIAL